jgi:hypothetical protein
MTFSQPVIEAGETTAITDIRAGADLGNFRLRTPTWETYHHITTTAAYEGSVDVCFYYDGFGAPPDEDDMIMEHWERNQWVTISNTPDTSYNKISGTVSSQFQLGTESPLLATPAVDHGIDMPYFHDFDGTSSGWIPQTPSGSSWAESSGVYTQTDDDDNSFLTDYGYDHIALVDTADVPLSSENYVIQVKARQTSSPALQWGGWHGLVFRHQGSIDSPYYTVLLKSLGGKFGLEFWTFKLGPYPWTDTDDWQLVTWSLISDPTFDVMDWHIMTAVVQGNSFEFYIDGSFMFRWKDIPSPTHTPLTAGGVGLYTEGVVVEFDDWTMGIPEDTLITIPPNTYTCDDHPDVDVTFNDVSGAGETTVIGSSEYPGPDIGNFYLEEVGLFYDIITTAEYDGDIEICVEYDDTGIPDESLVGLYHWEGNQWVDVTDRPEYPDTIQNVVCGTVSSLSWFVVGYLTIDPPDVTITGPASGSLFQVDAPVPFEATFTDTDDGDTHTALWEFESGGNIIPVIGTVSQGNGGGTVIDNIPFINPGVYTVTLTLTDSYGLQGSASTIGDLPAFIVIYDPEGGFVTGGGWIYSQPGAYGQDGSLEGKATFGFVAKYKKGLQVPSGQTEFKFKVADLNLHSTSYQWLIITGAKAQFKGTGTINGGDEYNFKLWATDGALPGGGGEDKFRMKIWQEDGEGIEDVLYDNGMETPLGGGQIVIHKT